MPSFFIIPALRECISTHKVRAQLDIRDVILRGLGMCLQQANSVRVITKALLANLRKAYLSPLYETDDGELKYLILSRMKNLTRTLTTENG